MPESDTRLQRIEDAITELIDSANAVDASLLVHILQMAALEITSIREKRGDLLWAIAGRPKEKGPPSMS